MTDTFDISIREARDNDADALIKLIGDIFKDYENCVLDLETLDKELVSIDTYIKGLGGKFWIAEQAGKVIGCIGYGQKNGDIVELKRMYVARKARRKGLATRLYMLVLEAAKTLNANAIDLWSDTRFDEAHAFYLAKGFEQLPETRDLNDPSNSTEFHFIKYL